MYKLTFIILLLSLTVSDVKADWISLIKADQCETIIETYIEDNFIRVTLEIGQKDYAYFKDIIPVQYYQEGYTIENKKQKFHDFFTSDFIIKADNKTLLGEVKNIELQPRKYRSSIYTGQIDTLNSKISKEVLFVDITYKVHQPKKVSVTPPMLKGDRATLANIGFVAYHNNLPLNDLRYLSNTEKVALNWKDPWYSKFENKNLARHHQNSFMSFLYVEDYEVRHELIVRLKDLDEWIDLDYGINEVLDYKELSKIRARVADFLAKRNKVIIDGREEKPILDKANFIEVKLSGVQILEEKTKLKFSSAILGVIFVYPQKKLPQQVIVKWDLWGEKINKIPTVTQDPAGSMPYDLTRGDSALIYNNHLTNYTPPTIAKYDVQPVTFRLHYLSIIFLFLIAIQLWRIRKKKAIKKRLGLLIIATFLGVLLFPIHYKVAIPMEKTSSLSRSNAHDLVTNLLKNTYRAFDFREEGEVYDKLAISNNENLLADLYLQTKKSMILKQQGGIQVKLKDLDVLEVEEVNSEKEGVSYQCLWRVKGDVGHWGHLHQRTNQYKAILNLRPEEGVWKMYAMDIIEEERL